MDGAFPESVAVVLQTIWSGPALAVVGGATRVTVTSSVVGAQGVLEMVQRRVYVVPATPVKLVDADEALLNDPPVPETTVHAPVPAVGVFAVMATVVPQKLLSVPALAAAGALLKVMFTSSVEAAHPGLERVQRNV